LDIVENDPIWGSGYLVSGEEEGSVKLILGPDSPFSTESGTMGVKMFNGTLNNGAPDPKFYDALGIGTTIVLPDMWIKIFGFEFKSGSLLIQKSGVKYIGSEIRK